MAENSNIKPQDKIYSIAKWRKLRALMLQKLAPAKTVR